METTLKDALKTFITMSWSQEWFDSIWVITACLAYYIFTSIAYRYFLKALSKDFDLRTKLFVSLAWVPILRMVILAVVAYGANEDSYIFGLKAPTWLLACYLPYAYCVSNIPEIGTILCIATLIIGAGSVFSNVYARIENTPVRDQYIIGYVTGAIPVIAFVKFVTYLDQAEEKTRKDKEEQTKTQQDVDTPQESGT